MQCVASAKNGGFVKGFKRFLGSAENEAAEEKTNAAFDS